jgi:hydrogenase nickel incorporation protein HypA/HybF
MHELTVIENILRITLQVAKDNQLKTVYAINLEVGEMQHLNEDIMQHGFQASVKDTPVNKDALRLTWLDVKLKCNACGNEFEPEEGKFHCAFCGEKDTSVIRGMELTIKSIEGE